MKPYYKQYKEALQENFSNGRIITKYRMQETNSYVQWCKNFPNVIFIYHLPENNYCHVCLRGQVRLYVVTGTRIGTYHKLPADELIFKIKDAIRHDPILQTISRGFNSNQYTIVA